MGPTSARMRVMKRIAFFVAVAVVFCLASQVEAAYNWNAKFQLHYAGAHDAKLNTCDLAIVDCSSEIVVDGGPGGVSGETRYDIYVIGIDTNGVAGCRYGLVCDGPFYFYGWTNCSSFEIPQTGWPGNGLGNAHAWQVEQPPGHIIMGILDLYVYATSVSICTGPDPRKGFAQWCDADPSEPLCNQSNSPEAGGNSDLYFGCVGFNGNSGVSRCDVISTEEYSWGRIKTLYR